MLEVDLGGKQVVVTGGASNIGRGITHAFSEQHAAITIDVLVNNMGWGDPSLFLDSDPARCDRMWRLNLGATIGCSHAALALMRTLAAGGCREGHGSFLLIARDGLRLPLRRVA